MQSTQTTPVTSELNCACGKAEHRMISYAFGVPINNTAENRTPDTTMREFADQAMNAA